MSASDLLPADASQRPTRVRYLVVAAAALMSVTLYLDRFCVTFVERLIKEDLNLSNEQISYLFSALFFSYALLQVPAGWSSDRFGSRGMLSLYILLWSLFTGLTGLASTFAVLFALRIAFGSAQAGAYPTAGSLLARWMPLSERGFASGIVAVGGRVGGVLAPLLTGYLIVLLVPTSVTSELKPGDVMDPAGWSRELLEPDEKLAPIARRIVELLPTSAQEALKEFSATGEGTDAQRAALVEGINGVLSLTLHEASGVEELPLESEARRLLKQPTGEWTLDETRRVNRLILEAAFPDHVKKVYIAGWRPVLVIYGLVGAVVAAVFWIVCRNRPSEHPWCNPEEIQAIQHGRPPESNTRLPGVPLVRLAASRSMWLCSITQVGTNVGWVFLVTWLPRYLLDVHRVPVEQRSLMAAVPLFVGWFGMVMGGPLTDRMTRRLGIRWGRALPMGLTRFLAMAAYLFCLLPLSTWFGPAAPWVITAAFAVVAFATDLGVASIWAFNQDVGGRQVGSVLGWGNMWGNLGAAISPPLLNWVVGKGDNWDMAFLVCAASFLISGLAALGVDATRPIVPAEE